MSALTKPVSVIHIFEGIKATIGAINTPPLSIDALKINKDEIASLGDEEYETGVPFARISIDFPLSNSEFTFCMDFLNTGVVLTILGLEPLWREYAELGETNSEISRLITETLICISNGQLSMLVTSTEDDHRLQAFELLYRQNKHQKYDAICTGTVFQSKRKLKGREYTTDFYANYADIKSISLDVEKAQLLLMPDYNFEQMSNIGRRNITGLHEPLTLELFTANVDAYAQKVGEDVAARVEKKFEGLDEKLDAAERKMGVHGMSLSQQFVHFAKWRHIELIFWSVLLLVGQNIALSDSSNIHFGLYLLAPIVLILFAFRNKYPYPQILYLLAPVAYLIFAVSTLFFLSNFVNSWVSWVIVITASISLIENIFFDMRLIKRRWLKV